MIQFDEHIFSDGMKPPTIEFARDTPEKSNMDTNKFPGLKGGTRAFQGPSFWGPPAVSIGGSIRMLKACRYVNFQLSSGKLLKIMLCFSFWKGWLQSWIK